MSDQQDSKLFSSLVYLADTLVTGFDVVDLADHLVSSSRDLLGVAAAGILVDDQQGGMRVLASAGAGMRGLELLEVQSNEGPCWQAFSEGVSVAVPDLTTAADRWPHFVPRVLDQGSLNSMPALRQCQAFHPAGVPVCPQRPGTRG